MDPTENEETETPVTGDDAEADTSLDTSADAGDDSGGSTGAPGEPGEDSKAAVEDGPKSLAEALSAGIESATKKSEKAGAEKADEGKKGAEDGKGEKKDATDGEKDKGADDGKKPDGKDGQPDHVNDPIDARLAPRTQERIRSLADEVKTLREVSTNNGAMIGAIMDTGATPQEFGAMVGYLGAVHSDDPARLEAAYQLLQSELQGLALRMGKPLAEVNWLEGHQDLIDAIRSGATTRELAIELAMGRATKKRNDATTAAKTKQTETATATEKDTKTASDELDALGTELLAADPLYKAKYALIVPKLRAEFAKIPPRQWKTRFLEEYARAKVAAPKVAAPAVKVNPPKNQPIRPSSPSGGTQKAPGSALDALSSAIDGMRS